MRWQVESTIQYMRSKLECNKVLMTMTMMTYHRTNLELVVYPLLTLFFLHIWIRLDLDPACQSVDAARHSLARLTLYTPCKRRNLSVVDIPLGYLSGTDELGLFGQWVLTQVD